jgi:predicted amidohydrolase
VAIIFLETADLLHRLTIEVERIVKVALYQNYPIFGEIEKNLDDVIEAVSGEEFDILVLPELFAAGYLFSNRREALSMADQAGSGSTFERLSGLSHKKNALIVYGFPEKKGEKLFNSSLAVLPDGRFYVYQKTHLFDTEKEIFDPGTSGFFVFEYKKARVGMMICFDWRFPESARKLALSGAQIICHPSNLVLPHCPAAMIIRALENNLFTITADRVGEENRVGQKLKFIGNSRIISPSGEILASLDGTATGFISVDINPQLADNKKVTPHNDLFDDRRPEFY